MKGKSTFHVSVSQNRKKKKRKGWKVRLTWEATIHEEDWNSSLEKQPLQQREEQENMKFKYSRRGVMTYGITAKLNFNT